MINPFQFGFAPNDQSIIYLSKIFGSMNGILVNPNGGTASVSSSSLLGTMFSTFNMTILTVAIFVVIYVTIVGVMQTAHEGEFMGKRWNNIWVPLRMVIGIGSLIPVPGSGYSTLQLIMMWVIMQGIGAADTLWTTSLTYIGLTGSPYAKPSVPTIGVSSTLQGLFQSLVCEASAAETRPNPTSYDKGGYYCSGPNAGDPWCNPSNRPNLDPTNTTVSTYTIGPGGNCGALSYCKQNEACAGDKADSLACLSCKQQVAALPAIIQTFRGIAQEFQDTDYAYRDFYENSYNNLANPNWSWIYTYCSSLSPSIPQNMCCVPSQAPPFTSGKSLQACGSKGSAIFYSDIEGGSPSSPSNDAVTKIYWPSRIQPIIKDSEFIKIATNEYMASVQQAINEYIAAQVQSGKNNSLSGAIGVAQKYGWMLAGTYYYRIADMNDNNFKQAMPEFTMSQPAKVNANEALAAYRNNYAAAASLFNLNGNDSFNAGSAPQLSGLNSNANAVFTFFSEMFLKATSDSESNPLSDLQSMGRAFLITAEVLIGVLLIATVGLGVAGNISVFAAGWAVTNFVGGMASLLYSVFVPLFYALVGFLILVGGTLSVYVPLIPYIVFTTSAVGWFISVVEAMVAGPLVALGILSPSGEHEVLGKAHHALLLMLHVFLRPSLMIFGLMAAMLLAVQMVNFINLSFWSVANSISGTPDPIGFILFFSAYVMLIVTVLNKCFAAIYLVPQGVMRWIGGQAESYGEAEGVQEHRQGGSTAMAKGGAGAETAQSGLKGATDSLGKFGSKRDRNRQAAEDRADKGKGEGGFKGQGGG